MLPTSNVRSPRRCGLHYGLIDADWEEHRLSLLLFFFQCGSNLALHPGAFKRMFREHQQQLVILADGLIDAHMDIVTNLHILWRKPTAHPLALKVGVESLGKIFIFAGVTDETGGISDGTMNQ